MKNTRLYLILLALIALTPTAWAQGLSGSGTTEDPYLINNNADWVTFAQSVTNDSTYAGQTVKLAADIYVTEMVGLYRAFSGTLDGDGHTITLALSGSGEGLALFYMINGATLKKMKVQGSVATDKHRPATFAAFVEGNSTISNCWSTVAVSSTRTNDWVDGGGFVGYAAQGANTFEGCAFTGKLLGADTYYVGGFVGYTETNNGATVAFTNCLFHPSQVTIGTNGGQTFARWRSGNSSVIIGDNCYYSQIPATAQAHVGMTWLLGYEP